jgi:hypothetical protein
MPYVATNVITSPGKTDARQNKSIREEVIPDRFLFLDETRSS